MKRISVNILCSTAVTLLLLSLLGTVSGAHFLLINSVFQSFLVNVVIYIGLFFTHRFESSYAVLEMMLDLVFIEAVAVIFGAVFDWYSCISIGVLAGMTVIVYFVGILLNIVQMRQEIEEINVLLQKRNHTISKETSK